MSTIISIKYAHDLESENKKKKKKYESIIKDLEILSKKAPNLFLNIEDHYDRLNHIIENSFFEGFNNKIYFSNASFNYTNRKGEERISRNIHFRIPRHPFIDDNFPNGTTLLFKGYIKDGYFAIESIKLTSDYEGDKSFEKEINVNIYYKELLNS